MVYDHGEYLYYEGDWRALKLEQEVALIIISYSHEFYPRTHLFQYRLIWVSSGLRLVCKLLLTVKLVKTVDINQMSLYLGKCFLTSRALSILTHEIL